MIRKTFDYYYLVWMRWTFGKNTKRNAWYSYQISGFISLILWFNFVSLAILFSKDIDVEQLDFFWVIFIIGNLIVPPILCIIYNKKRRDELRQKYKFESRESRRRGGCKVVLYMVLSLALFIFALSTLSPPCSA